MSRKKSSEIVWRTYWKILNSLEFKILEQFLDIKSDNKDFDLNRILYNNLEIIKTYDEFKQFIFWYVWFVRKTTINTDGVLNPLLEKIENWVKGVYLHNEEKKDQLIGYVKMIQDDIYKD